MINFQVEVKAYYNTLNKYFFCRYILILHVCDSNEVRERVEFYSHIPFPRVLWQQFIDEEISYIHTGSMSLHYDSSNNINIAEKHDTTLFIVMSLPKMSVKLALAQALELETPVDCGINIKG